jgi:hypothetical protein
VLSANLEALGHRHPAVARSVSEVKSVPGMTVETARSGEPTARLKGSDGPGPYLHSRVDPRADGVRSAGGVSPAAGFVVVWGPGLFYEVEALLGRTELAVVLIAEPRPELLRAALEARDVSALLADVRLHIRAGDDAGPDALAAAIQASYLPVIHGAFRLELPRARAEEAAAAARAMDGAAHAQLEDLSVQRRFGRRWLSNAVRNLAAVPAVELELPAFDTVAVAAAGPSLEEQVAGLDGSLPVIATDTALPALIERGIRPALVVSLDCQQVSYHHLLAARARTDHAAGRCPALLADLSTPPTLLRHATGAVMGLSDYPLARLLERRFPDMPLMRKTGGNVTQAAVSTAAALGARRIHLLGADLSYPEGKTYARDTYLYLYFRSRETRFLPAHSGLFEMVLADPQTTVHDDEGRRRYVPPKLAAYRRNLQRLIDELEVEVLSGPPERETGAGADARDKTLAGATRRYAVPPREERRAWLETYAEAVKALPAGPAVSAGSFASLGGSERELWYTILPTAATFVDGSLDVRRTPETLERARQWVTGTLERVLVRYAANPTPP